MSDRQKLWDLINALEAMDDDYCLMFPSRIPEVCPRYVKSKLLRDALTYVAEEFEKLHQLNEGEKR